MPTRRSTSTGSPSCPGLIDEHFHVFWGYGWETYQGATRAAAKGGITTVVDMPLDQPATLTVQRLQEKLAHDPHRVPRRLRAVRRLPGRGSRRGCSARRGRHRRAQALHRRSRTARACTPAPTPARSSTAMRRARRGRPRRRRPLRERRDRRLRDGAAPGGGPKRGGGLGRGAAVVREVEAVQRVALAAEITGCRTVIAHVTSHQPSTRCVTSRSTRRRRLDRDVPALPLPHDRRHGERRRVSSGTRRAATQPQSSGSGSSCADGHVHTVGSDHAPLPKKPAPTSGRSSPGPATVSSRCCPLVATEAARRGLPLHRVVDLLSTTPARLFGLFPRKGTIAVGARRRFRRARDQRPPDPRRAGARVPRAGEVVAVRRLGGDRLPRLHGPPRAVIFAEGAVTGEPGHGEFLTKRAAVAV